ncbi:MAG TPA: TetR family transcriptional regulator [Solirubrobacteraceae bacterium]|jgi:AcrR family transcriptional regulator
MPPRNAKADVATVALERLRPGRDSHSRDKVDGIQRARIVSAMAEVVTEQRLPAATVANVVAGAGVSRRTFYELFADREECFLAAFDHAAGLAAEAVLAAYAQSGAWRDRIRAGLLALLEFLDEEPSLGALCIVHSLGAGPVALERRGRLVDALIVAVDEGRETQGGRRSATTAPLTAEGVVGAVLAVIHARLVQPSSRAMVELLGPLMNMIVLPYQGAAAANKELSRPSPKGHSKPRRPAGDPLKDLDMRLTYRTVRVLIAIAASPGTSNRQVGEAAGIADQGQISKLLQRLTSLGLIENTGAGHSRGEANAWQLTSKGLEVERTIRAEATPSTAG